MSVFIDGRIEPDHTPVLCAEDQGFTLGLSVFETLRVQDGHAYFLDAHLERLRHGAQALSLPWPPPWSVAAAVARLVAEDDAQRCAARVTYSRGARGRPTLLVTTRAIDPLPRDGVRVAVASQRLLAGDPLAALKSSDRLRYVLAREEARARGAFEALLLSHEGDVAEGSVSNLFAVLDDVLWTPAVGRDGRGGLAGIVRGVILTELERDPLRPAGGAPLELQEGRLELAQLAGAGELFLTNSTSGVVPVLELLGVAERPLALPGGRGPVARAVANRLAAAEERDRGARGNLTGGCA